MERYPQGGTLYTDHTKGKGYQFQLVISYALVRLQWKAINL